MALQPEPAALHPKVWRQMVACDGAASGLHAQQYHFSREMLDEREPGMVNCLCGCA